MSKPTIAKTDTISIRVGLDEQRTPVKITWESPNNPNGEGEQECKAMFLSVFDPETKDTLRIDLWTTEMQVVEMDRFFYQMLRGLSDTYFRSTQNNALASAMKQFAQYFGEETEILPKTQ